VDDAPRGWNQKGILYDLQAVFLVRLGFFHTLYQQVPCVWELYGGAPADFF
jgi:hypothetical protein